MDNGWILKKKVRFLRDVDRYPHDVVEKGETGTIMQFNGRTVAVFLDKRHGALDEWENCLEYYPGNGDFGFLGDFEVVERMHVVVFVYKHLVKGAANNYDAIRTAEREINGTIDVEQCEDIEAEEVFE